MLYILASPKCGFGCNSGPGRMNSNSMRHQSARGSNERSVAHDFPCSCIWRMGIVPYADMRMGWTCIPGPHEDGLDSWTPPFHFWHVLICTCARPQYERRHSGWRVVKLSKRWYSATIQYLVSDLSDALSFVSPIICMFVLSLPHIQLAQLLLIVPFPHVQLTVIWIHFVLELSVLHRK